MAGTLELSESLCWMPAGWVFDNALEGMAIHLGPGLREQLLNSLTDVNGGHLDLRAADADEFESIFEALRKLIQETREAGPSGMHDPSFFDGYLAQLVELEVIFSQYIVTWTAATNNVAEGGR